MEVAPVGRALAGVASFLWLLAACVSTTGKAWLNRRQRMPILPRSA